MARATHRGRRSVRKDRGADVDKGLLSGNLEGGIHFHVLERQLGRTVVDGAHRHVFRLPSGDLVATEEDGGHGHFIDGDGRWDGVYGGEHTHKLVLGGEELLTDAGSGHHSHVTQVETTALDGVHVHTIRLPDGSTIQSLLPHEEWALSQATTDTAPMMASMDGAAKASLRFAGERPMLDVRVTNGKSWNAWTLNIGRELPDEPLRVEDGAAVAKSFSLHGSKHFHALLDASVPAVMLSEEAAKASVHDRERDEAGHLVFVLDDCEVEFGVQEQDLREFFLVGKAFTGRLVLAKSGLVWNATLTRGGLPCVLDKSMDIKADKFGHIEPALPRSLQDAIPEHLRWWTEEDVSVATAKRDFLVNTMFFTEENVMLVDKRFTKVEVEKSYFRHEPDESSWTAAIAKIFPKGVKVVSPFAEDDWRASLEKNGDSGAIVVLDPPDPTEFQATRLARLVKQRAGEWLLAHEDSPMARAAFETVGRVFKLKHPGAFERIFVASFPITADVLWIDKAYPKKPKKERGDMTIGPGDPGYKQPDQGERRRRRKAEIDRLLEGARLLRKAEDEEERFVYGVVLEPDGVDAQNDTISPEEIRSAAHKFMEDFQNLGLQHMRFINGKAKILESFIVPEDIRIGGEMVKQGTWMFGVRVVDDDIWKAVKDGLLTGFSIGGSAVREPVET